MKASTGIRQQLDLAMPIGKAAPLCGVVFIDEDGDGVRDPGENPLPDLPVSLVNEPGSAWAL